MKRAAVALGALILAVGALVGVRFSGASWTDGSTSGVNVQASPDWTPPTGVAVTSTGGGVLGTVQIGATASDTPTGVASVTLEYATSGSGSWQPLCTDTTSPYSCSWDTATVADGTYDLRATAVDVEDNATTSPIHTTDVVNTATIQIDPVASPATGQIPLSGQFLNTRSAPTTLAIQYAAAGSGSWNNINGCNATSGPTKSCTWNSGNAGANGLQDLRIVGTVAGTTFTAALTNVMVDNDDPSVTTTVPASPLSGTIAISADATDTGGSGVASVLFEYRRGNQAWSTCGTDTSAPYACQVDTTALTDGDYTFRATATDLVGKTDTHTASAAVQNLTLTMPPLAAAVRGTVQLNATWGGPTTEIVAFHRSSSGTGGWQALCTNVPVSPSPASCSWDTTAEANQTWYIRARVQYNSNNYDVIRQTVVDNELPTASLTVPAGTLNGTVQLTATASDAVSAVVSVQFERKLTSGSTWTTCALDTTAPYSCSLATGSLADGSYDFRAVVTDAAGNQFTTATQTRTVNNTSPWARVASPTAGTVIPQGSDVVVTAEGYSPSGIASMQLQYDPAGATGWTVLCTDTTAPYSCPWDTLGIPAGSLDLRVVMTRNSGSPLTVTSPLETVTVEQLRGLTVNAHEGSGNVGLPGAGDSVVLTYSREVSLSEIKPGWVDPSSPQTVPITLTDANVAGGPGGEWMAFGGTDLGTVGFAQNYVQANKQIVFGGSTMTAQTVVVGGVPVTQVTIVLSARTDTDPPGWINDTNNNAGNMTWRPSTAVVDLNGSVCDGVDVSEGDAPVDTDL